MCVRAHAWVRMRVGVRMRVCVHACTELMLRPRDWHHAYSLHG